MLVEVIERHLESRTGEKSGGEDRLVCGPRFFGVIDGGTDHTCNDWGNGRNGGATIAEIVLDVLKSPECTDDPKELVNEINGRINMGAEEAGIDLSEVRNRADVAFAAFVPTKNAVYHIHDCSFTFVKKNGGFEIHSNEKLVDGLTSDVRACVVSFLKRNGIYPFADGADMGRAFISHILAAQPELQNIQTNDQTKWFGIPKGSLASRTLNGLPTEICVTQVPDDVSELVFASDGFKEIRPTLAESLSILRRLQEEDPYCIGPLKGTKRVEGKTFDDTCYLRIRLLNAQSE